MEKGRFCFIYIYDYEERLLEQSSLQITYFHILVSSVEDPDSMILRPVLREVEPGLLKATYKRGAAVLPIFKISAKKLFITTKIISQQKFFCG